MNKCVDNPARFKRLNHDLEVKNGTPDADVLEAGFSLLYVNIETSNIGYNLCPENIKGYLKVIPERDADENLVFTETNIGAAYDKMTLSATYQRAYISLIEKMKDNLHQLFVINPYEMGRAIVNAKVGSFFYHLLGMVHALLSIPADLAVELTALATRGVKQMGVNGYIPIPPEDTGFSLSLFTPTEF